MQAEHAHKLGTISRTTPLRLLCQYCVLYCQSANPKHQWNKSCWNLAMGKLNAWISYKILNSRGSKCWRQHWKQSSIQHLSVKQIWLHSNWNVQISFSPCKPFVQKVKFPFFHWNNKSWWTTWINKCWISFQLCCHWNKRWTGQFWHSCLFWNATLKMLCQ